MKRTARETLSAAIEAFSSLGAVGFRARAEAEIGRIGGRGQSEGGLTPTEIRVVDLVVKGMSNKEVAAALVISSKTVELHLSHVYAKLDVASRTELVRYMSDLPATVNN
jgi:DNA-binding NarL/FixJ family response regulator